jgi:hypothetical protein
MRAPNARTTSHAAIMTIKGAIGYHLLIRGSGSEADTTNRGLSSESGGARDQHDSRPNEDGSG